jgi:hypothetical protein
MKRRDLLAGAVDGNDRPATSIHGVTGWVGEAPVHGAPATTCERVYRDADREGYERRVKEAKHEKA